MQGNDAEVQAVVDAFWGRRDGLVALHAQTGVQGGAARSGSHMEAIQSYIRSLFQSSGLPAGSVRFGSPSLPGYFRRAKSWDVVVTYRETLVAAVELKSQVGSVGNNANNRIEEALGNAVDVHVGQKNRQVFGAVPPWLGFVMILEETAATERRLHPADTIFPQDEIFRSLSYSKQYGIALGRFISERLYDGAWFLTTKREVDGTFSYEEPLKTATAATFAGLVQARVNYVKRVVDAY